MHLADLMKRWAYTIAWRVRHPFTSGIGWAARMGALKGKTIAVSGHTVEDVREWDRANGL